VTEPPREARSGEPAGPGGAATSPKTYGPPHARSPGPHGPHVSPPSRAASPEPRDRPLVHLIWEGVLLVVAVALLAVISVTTPGRNLVNVLGQAGYVGLAATALAFSLRTGTPNLAVGPIAGLTGGITAVLMTEDWPVPAAMAVALAVAVAIGAVLGVLVAALSVPAWAATLGAGTVLTSAFLAFSGTGSVIIARHGVDFPAVVWLGLFLVISIGGGLLWLLPRVRRTLSATRHAGEPGRWAGARAALGAVIGIAGSSLLAALAGIAELLRLQAASPVSGQFLTITALAAVLLGGVSVFGRRAGVAGTALGVMIVVMAQNLLVIHGAASYVTQLFLGAVIIVGLGVTRLLESLQQN
jgi:ribose/xylose/arabinose/galactoside ABC-type transport system permease subunit